MKLLLGAMFALTVAAAVPAQPNKGFSGESLAYTVNWPSGLSLGESQLSATKAENRYQFSFDIQASIPGFSIGTNAKATATPQFCSLTLDKDIQRGARKSTEHTAFDQEHQSAERETKNGGKATFNLPTCGKDALTFLYYIRQELAQGRLPVPQTVYYGAAYDVRLEFGGRQNLRLTSGSYDVDKIVAHVKGPSSDVTAEIFLAHDETRTPVLVRVPLALGTFSMEISR